MDGWAESLSHYFRFTACRLILFLLMIFKNRFKYPPYWVPLKKLWDAMCVVDKATGNPRGYFVVKSSQ